MPSDNKSKVSSKSKDKKSDKKTDKDKKSDSKTKSDKKTDDKKSKSVKSDKKSEKSASPSKSAKGSEKGSKKDSKKDSKKGKDDKSSKSKVKDDKSSKSKKKDDLNASQSQIGLDVENVEMNQTMPVGGMQPPMIGGGIVNPNAKWDALGASGFDRKKFCLLHKQPLRYFCDSCEELICYDCTVMGPHNTQLHRISSIDEAFRYRFDAVNKNIHQSLVPKRAQLIG
jgi:hypothetical protein